MNLTIPNIEILGHHRQKKKLVVFFFFFPPSFGAIEKIPARGKKTHELKKACFFTSFLLFFFSRRKTLESSVSLCTHLLF